MKRIAPTLKNELEIIEDASRLFMREELLRDIDSTLRLEDVSIHTGDIEGCRLKKIDLTSTNLEKLTIKDTLIEQGSLAACVITESGWRQVSVSDTRLSGTLLQLSGLRDVVFKDCKLDFTNFRYAKLQGVLFDSCQIDDIDFYGANLTNVTFDHCMIEKIDVRDATLKNVDFCSSDIGTVRGITHMRGASVSSLQLVSLAPYMARDLGIIVKDDPYTT